jgi:hypothetical protein
LQPRQHRRLVVDGSLAGADRRVGVARRLLDLALRVVDRSSERFSRSKADAAPVVAGTICRSVSTIFRLSSTTRCAAAW